MAVKAMEKKGFFSKVFRKNRNRDKAHAAEDDAVGKLSSLDASCSEKFTSSFRKCRYEFGREFVELMDIKKKMIGEIKSAAGYYPVRDMVAEKVLKLIGLYFEMASSFVSVKNDNGNEEWAVKRLETVKANMEKARSLIISLNNQFYLSTAGTGLSAGDPAAEGVTGEEREILNEAEALFNVLMERSSKLTAGS